MQVPVLGSKVKVKVRNSMGPVMIPPQPNFTEFEGTVVAPYKWMRGDQFSITGDIDWPVRVFTMALVEDISLLSGTMQEVATDTKTWVVDGSKGNKYNVTRNGTKWSCTCPGFGFRNVCKHITELSKA